MLEIIKSLVTNYYDWLGNFMHTPMFGILGVIIAFVGLEFIFGIFIRKEKRLVSESLLMYTLKQKGKSLIAGGGSALVVYMSLLFCLPWLIGVFGISLAFIIVIVPNYLFAKYYGKTLDLSQYFEGGKLPLEYEEFKVTKIIYDNHGQVFAKVNDKLRFDEIDYDERYLSFYSYRLHDFFYFYFDYDLDGLKSLRRIKK